MSRKQTTLEALLTRPRALPAYEQKLLPKMKPMISIKMSGCDIVIPSGLAASMLEDINNGGKKFISYKETLERQLNNWI